MSNQIFKSGVPSSLLFELLEKISLKSEKCYTVNNNSYKKGVFTKDITTFLEECSPYYHISKRKYLDCKLTYNSFTTVIRQLCKFNNIKYTSQIKYDKSKYDIVYYIYFNT